MRLTIDIGDTIRAQQPIAEICNLFGEVVERVVSPRDGIARLIWTHKAVNTGDPIVKCWVVAEAAAGGGSRKASQAKETGVRVESQKLSEFFNIGRDLGWDVEQPEVDRQLPHRSGGALVPPGRDHGGWLPLDLPLVKSGNRYGYPPLRDLIVASQRYTVSP